MRPRCTRSFSTPAARACSTCRTGPATIRVSTTARCRLAIKSDTKVRSAAKRAASPISTRKPIPALLSKYPTSAGARGVSSSTSARSPPVGMAPIRSAKSADAERCAYREEAVSSGPCAEAHSGRKKQKRKEQADGKTSPDRPGGNQRRRARVLWQDAGRLEHLPDDGACRGQFHSGDAVRQFDPASPEAEPRQSRVADSSGRA